MNETPRRSASEGVSTNSTMRRVSVAMFVGGGLVSGAGVWTTQQTVRSQIFQAVVAGTLLLVGLLLATAGPQTQRTMESCALMSIGLLGVLIASSEPLGMAPIFFLWPVVFLAYFSSPRRVAVGFGCAVVALATGLAINDNAMLRFDTFLGTSVSVGMMAWLIASLTLKEHQLRSELSVAAETDPLTGLLNRRSFNPRLEALVANVADYNGRLALAMFDLDHFKAVNDNFGHSVGDTLLVHVARSLENTARYNDMVVRLGGEEFAVVLPGATLADAEKFATRAAEVIRAAPEPVGSIATSVGLACLGHDVTSTHDLLVRADQALYAAKVAGRDRAASWIGQEAVVARTTFSEAGTVLNETGRTTDMGWEQT